MADYYARRAAEYERVYEKPERQDDLRQLRAFVEEAFAGQDVFELACGTGYWTQYAARKAHSFLATDFNDETLTIARAKQIACRALTFARADAYDLPHFSQRFNAGLAAFWWSHVPKSRLRRFLEGFQALFQPGSRIVFIDNRYVEGGSTPISRVAATGDSFQMRHLSDGSAHEVLKNFPTEAELREAVKGLALKTEVRLLPYYWILSYTAA
jgi:demethylmenaquinone methyltransferase/2-methoxy-6-polyprenyl-1,4-benzoquinol methylase